MPHALLLGGTGQIGQATAAELLDHGWSVTLAQRGTLPAPMDLVARGVAIVQVDRERPGELGRALGGGADLLLDAIAYGPEHGRQVLDLQGNVGALMVVSSSRVYRDDAGRALDEAAATGFPRLPDPIRESQPTVDPGPETYSTRKVALEHLLLEAATVPLTILRPAAISGRGAGHAREWWFVKRMLDRRPAIPLAYRGTSRFHTSAVVNIAALARVAAETPGSRVLNIADPDMPTVAEIAAFAARHLDYEGRIAGVDDPRYPPLIGRTPWSLPQPFVLDCRAARGLGYSPTTTYADAVGTACDWLVNGAANGDWKERYPVLASYPRNHFDFDTEDAFFRTLQ